MCQVIVPQIPAYTEFERTINTLSQTADPQYELTGNLHKRLRGREGERRGGAKGLYSRRTKLDFSHFSLYALLHFYRTVGKESEEKMRQGGEARGS